MDKVDLVVVVPTWNRWTNCWRLADAFKRTGTDRTLLMFVVSDSGDHAAMFSDIANVSPGCVYAPYPGPAGRGVTAPLNYGAALAAAIYDPVAIGFMGDDHLPRTVGWDAEYVRALRLQGGGWVHGNDLIQGEQLATEIAMTTQVYRELGYFGLPTLPHLYVDNAWTHLGNALDRLTYLDDVVIEHMHHTNGLAALDDTYTPGLYEDLEDDAKARQIEHLQTLVAYQGHGWHRDARRLAQLWPEH